MSPKSKLLVCVLAALLSGAAINPAVAAQAGDACTASPGGIPTQANGDATDLLACVSGTWHSLIYPAAATVPSGAILAFALSNCPSGWSYVPALAGRTVIGAGQGGGLSNRNLFDWGGEERHAMQVSEIAPHQVTMYFGASQKGGSGNGYAYSDNAGGSTVRATYAKQSDWVGGGQPFNVMMPYFTLLYCQKN